MRLWHKDLIPYLPDLQLKGQWRECALIADALAKDGTPNHLLVNRLTDYAPEHLEKYFLLVAKEMKKRGFLISDSAIDKIANNFAKWIIDNKKMYLVDTIEEQDIFEGWHNYEYLRICYANLLEKHRGIGKSRITDEEWQRLCDGYKAITGEEYKI